MRRFLKKIALYFGIMLLVIAGLAWSYKLKMDSLNIRPGITTLICGDSQPQTALNDSIIQSSMNIAQGNEHYFYTHQKLKYLLPRNPGIKLVILGISYQTFTTSFDKLIATMLPQHLLILDFTGKLFVVKQHPLEFLTSLRAITHEFNAIVNARSYSDYWLWGGFIKSDISKLDEYSIDDGIKVRYYETRGGLQGYSIWQEPYLKEIIRLCHDREIKIVLVGTPVNFRFADKIPDKFIRKFHSILGSIDSSKVVILDYQGIEMPDNCFRDGHHLNSLGAEKFSKLIAESLDK
jgi:hypothetical protein